MWESVASRNSWGLPRGMNGGDRLVVYMQTIITSKSMNTTHFGLIDSSYVLGKNLVSTILVAFDVYIILGSNNGDAFLS